MEKMYAKRRKGWDGIEGMKGRRAFTTHDSQLNRSRNLPISHSIPFRSILSLRESSTRSYRILRVSESSTVQHLREQSRDGKGVEHLGGHDDGDLQGECEADQLVCVALDEVRV